MLCEYMRALNQNPDEEEIRANVIMLLEAITRWLRRGGFPPKLNEEVMTLYKNLSPDKKKLYRRAYELALTDWHWTAVLIVYEVNGLKNAMAYLEQCGKHTKVEDKEWHE